MSTDSEHLHLVLPPGGSGDDNGESRDGDEEPVVLKCDLHERILDPNLLPFSYQYVSALLPVCESPCQGI